MENGSFSSDEFAAFTKTVVPFLHVTTRIEGRLNDDLLSVYGGRGFPTLKFLDAEGKAVAEPGGRSVEAFQTTADALNSLADLKKRIAKGEKGLDAKLLLAEMNLGSVTFADAKKRLAGMKKVKPETKAKIKAALVNLEFDDLLNSMTRENQDEIGEKVAKMAKDGRIPTGDTADMFWSVVSGWADENGDVVLLEKGYNHLFKKYGEEERAKEYFEKLKERIEELKKNADPDA